MQVGGGRNWGEGIVVWYPGGLLAHLGSVVSECPEEKVHEAIDTIVKEAMELDSDTPII